MANNYPFFCTTAGPACLAAVNGSYVADPFQTAATGFSNPYPFLAAGRLGQFFNPKLPFAYVVDPHFRTPYAYNYNYGLQYQLTRTMMVEAAYVGNANRKAVGTNETNYPLLSTLQQQYAANGSGGINPECARPLAACDSTLDPFGDPNGAQ